MSGVIEKAKPIIGAAIGAYVGFIVGGPSGALRGAALGYQLGSKKDKPDSPGGNVGSQNTPDTGANATAIGEQAWVPKSFGDRRSGMVLTATDLTNANHEIVEETGEFSYSVYTLGEGPWTTIKQLNYNSIKIFKDNQTINFGQIYSFEDSIFNDDIKNLEIEFVQGNATQSLSTMLSRVTWGYNGDNFAQGDRWYENTDVGNGICYMVVRVKRDKDALIRETAPQFTIDSEGKQIPEVRLQGQPVQYSGGTYNTGTNPGMIALDQLRANNFGLGLNDNEIDFDAFVKFANYCDNPGTYSNGQSIAPFTLNGQFNQGSSIKEILEQISLATGALFADENGIVTVKIDKQEVSTTTAQVNENNLIGNITRSEPTTSTTPNTINVTFIDSKGIESTEVLEFSSSVISKEGRKEADLTLRMVQNKEHAREIAKRMLYHMRQPTFTFNLNNTGYGIDTYGISNISDIFETTGVPASGLNMTSSGNKIRIFDMQKVRIQEDSNKAPVKVTAKLYSDQIYNTDPSGMVLSSSEKTSDAPGLYNIPQPQNLVISNLSDTTAKLEWTNVYVYNTLIEFKNAGAADSTYVEDKIVGNGPADITLPGPGTYDISIRFLIPNTSINTGPGPRNVYLSYVSTGTGTNVNAQNGLLIIDNKLDKGLKKHMHVKYASDANGLGLRPNVPASQEIQKIEYTDGSLATSKPSTFTYDNTTQTTEKVQLTIPNDFNAGTSVPEKHEFSYAGTNANQIDISTTGVNEQLQIIIANPLATATDPGEKEIQSLAFLTASASLNTGTTYQVRFGSNNVGSTIVSTGPSDSLTVAAAIKSRIDASSHGFSSVVTDDGVGNGLITITADADALVTDDWNILITNNGSLGYTFNTVQNGVNGGKPRTDEGTVSGTTTNVQVNVAEEFAQSEIITTLSSGNTDIFPNSAQIPTGAQTSTTRFYFAMKIGNFTGAVQPSVQTTNNIAMYSDAAATDEMFYITESSSGVPNNFLGNQQIDFSSKANFLTFWKNQSGNMISTTTSSSTDIHWWNMGVNEELDIIYFSAQAMTGTNFRVDHWADLNSAGASPRLYHDGDFICDFDMYWCHSAGSQRYIPAYRLRDTSNNQPYTTGNGSNDYWLGYAPTEFTKSVSDARFTIPNGGIVPSIGGNSDQKHLTRTIAGILNQNHSKANYTHFDGQFITVDYIVNVNSPLESELECDVKYGNQEGSRPTSWLVDTQNYTAPSTQGTLSSYSLTLPDGNTITPSVLTNVPSGLSKDQIGTLIGNAILGQTGFNRNSYNSGSSSFEYFRTDSNPYQVGNNFQLNHLTPNTDGQTESDISVSFLTINNAGDAFIQPTLTFDPDINNTVYSNALTYTFSKNLDRIGVAEELQAQIELLDSNITTTRTNHIINVDFGTQVDITASLNVTNEATNDGTSFITSKFILNPTDGVTEVINGQLSNITITSPEANNVTIVPLNNGASSLANINTSIVNTINNNSSFNTNWSATNDTGNNKIIISRLDQSASTGTYVIALNNKPDPAGSNPDAGNATISDLTYGTDTDNTLYQDSFDGIKTVKVDAKTFSFTGNTSVLLGGATVPTFGPVAFTSGATKVNAHTDILNALNANYTGTVNKTLISGDPNNAAVDDVYQYEFEVNDDIGATFTFGTGTSGSSSNITTTLTTPGSLGTKVGGGVITNADILKTDVIFRDDSLNVLFNKSYFHLDPQPAHGYINADFNSSIKTDMETAITNLAGWSTLTSTNTLFEVQSASAASSNGQFQLNITHNGIVPSGNTLWSLTPTNGTFVTTQIGGGLATFYGLRATDLATETIPDIAINASQYNWFPIENPNSLSTLYPSYKIVSGRIIEFEFDSNPLLAGYNNIPVNNIIDLDTPTTTVIENLPVNAPNSTPLNGSEMMFVDGSFYIAMRLSTNSTSVGTVINFVPLNGTLVYNDFTSSVTLTDQGYGTPTFVTEGVYQYDGSQGWTKLN